VLRLGGHLRRRVERDARTSPPELDGFAAEVPCDMLVRSLFHGGEGSALPPTAVRCLTERENDTMAMSVRFDPSAPYEVDEADVPFARPAGAELLARVPSSR
jgi:hypothetical protein